MVELAFKNVHKGYGGQPVLQDTNFEVTTGERIGLVGKNGAGKTTVFRLITGQEECDSGEVILARDRIWACLDQLPVYPDSFTVYDVLLSAFDYLNNMAKQLREMEPLLSQNDSNLLKKYGDLLSSFEGMGGYDIESNIGKVANGLGISKEMQAMPFSLLSGGEKTRINLARIILTKPDLLLLDEPTNHLDITSVEWLEGYLNEYQGTVIIISHDRYFLDLVATRIIELDNGKALSFEGNYSFYAVQKEMLVEQQLSEYENTMKKIKQLETAAKRMHDWANRSDNPSMHRRAFEIEKRIERIRSQGVERPRIEKSIQYGFVESEFSSSQILTVSNLSKSYGSKELFRDLSFKINKGERIALIGDNGTGKTTLLKIIMGLETADTGKVDFGTTVKRAMLEQIVRFEDSDKTVMETVMNELEIGEAKARSLLGAFKFQGDDVFKEINSLSGGERSRVKLCMLMQEDLGFLILDEPTNHLDILSREWIEESVDQFEGTLLFVSHDRYFISRFANRVIELTSQGVEDFVGGYEDYKKHKQGLQRIEELNKISEKSKRTKKKAKNVNPKSLERQLAKLEDEIEKIEQEKVDLELKIQENATDYVELEKLTAQMSELELSLHTAYEKWEETDNVLRNYRQDS